MRLASILNCSDPAFGGAQNRSECPTFTIVSDSCSHWLLFDAENMSGAMLQGKAVEMDCVKTT